MRPPRARERFDERAKTPPMKKRGSRPARLRQNPVPPRRARSRFVTFFFAYHDNLVMRSIRRR